MTDKYSFVRKKSTNKYEARLDAKVERLLPVLCSKYGVLANSLEEVLGILEGRVNSPFVHGRGKRKIESQRDIEQLRELRFRKQKYTRYNETFCGGNSFSRTDTDATMTSYTCANATKMRHDGVELSKHRSKFRCPLMDTASEPAPAPALTPNGAARAAGETVEDFLARAVEVQAERDRRVGGGNPNE